MANLVEDEKASKPGNAIRHRQYLKPRSATPSSIEIAQLGPPEVATDEASVKRMPCIKYRIYRQTYLSHVPS